MQNIRRNVFQTNSSSEHSVTSCYDDGFLEYIREAPVDDIRVIIKNLLQNSYLDDKQDVRQDLVLTLEAINKYD